MKYYSLFELLKSFRELLSDGRIVILEEEERLPEIFRKLHSHCDKLAKIVGYYQTTFTDSDSLFWGFMEEGVLIVGKGVIPQVRKYSEIGNIEVSCWEKSNSKKTIVVRLHSGEEIQFTTHESNPLVIDSLFHFLIEWNETHCLLQRLVNVISLKKEGADYEYKEGYSFQSYLSFILDEFRREINTIKVEPEKKKSYPKLSSFLKDE